MLFFTKIYFTWLFSYISMLVGILEIFTYESFARSPNRILFFSKFSNSPKNLATNYSNFTLERKILKFPIFSVKNDRICRGAKNPMLNLDLFLLSKVLLGFFFLVFWMHLPTCLQGKCFHELKGPSSAIYMQKNLILQFQQKKKTPFVNYTWKRPALAGIGEVFGRMPKIVCLSKN